YVADRVAVMYAGRIVEMAPKRELFANPRHPHTEALLAAALEPEPRQRRGSPPPPSDGPEEGPAAAGCAYACRCRYVVERCRMEAPELVPVGPDHLARCHRVDEIRLTPLLRQSGRPPEGAS
ncbi:MAG: peptide ABC transporter ATP-binding protein, partial [candidate division NC10 bacterium]|nr:peptide ABC transporter ATP-binding protein [candidate division NC10 bacterium]